MPDSWDVFVSYQSADANLVRAIIERLMAGGLRVWFAEDRVLLANYEAFAGEIGNGIRHTAYAVLFTTPKYAASDWCAKEEGWVRERLPANRILEIRLRPNKRDRNSGYPTLPSLLGISATTEACLQ